MATMFKKSVTALVESLTACNPHYIRTIKPNENKRPGEFDMERCTHQVRYLGLLENIRIRRAGYCYRVPMEKFLGRFKMLCPDTWPRASGAADVEKLLTPSDALRQTVLARAPLAAMVGYASALRSLTAGEASLSMEFSHYARVEPAVQQQLLLQMRGYV